MAYILFFLLILIMLGPGLIFGGLVVKLASIPVLWGLAAAGGFGMIINGGLALWGVDANWDDEPIMIFVLCFFANVVFGVTCTIIGLFT